VKSLIWGYFGDAQGVGVHTNVHSASSIGRLGESRSAPETECPFWADGCGFERIGLQVWGRPLFASWMLAIRRGLESGRRREDQSLRVVPE
jgi:hypothetical protein